MWQRYHITDGKCLHHQWCAICHKKYMYIQPIRPTLWNLLIIYFFSFFHLISSSCSADNWGKTNKKWKTSPDSKSQQSSKIIMSDFSADFGGGGTDKFCKIVVDRHLWGPISPNFEISACILCAFTTYLTQEMTSPQFLKFGAFFCKLLQGSRKLHFTIVCQALV